MGALLQVRAQRKRPSPAHLPRRIVTAAVSSSAYGANRKRLIQASAGAQAAVNKVYVQAAGQTVAIIEDLGQGQRRTRYLHHDHRDSVVAVTDDSGKVLERLAYDAFGKRRELNWLNDPSDAQLKAPHQTQWGFTQQEHLDNLALIHMNGRVYDPVLGRFTSADPFVQFPESTQGLNRYTYVNNNPLSYTDPSGFFLKRLFTGVQYVTGGAWVDRKFLGPHTRRNPWAPQAASVIVGFTTPAWLSPFLVGGIQAHSAYLQGASFTDAVRSGVIAGGTAFAFSQIGNWGDTAAASGSISSGVIFAGRVVAHGVVGGVSTELQGGEFRHGFYSAGVTAAVSPYLPRGPAGVISAAVVGGTVSVIGGGKFANGAVTAAFSYIFNHWAHNKLGSIYEDEAGYNVYNSEEWRKVGLVEIPVEDWQVVAALPVGGKGRIPSLKIEIEFSVDIQLVERRLGQYEVEQLYRVQRYRFTGTPTGIETTHPLLFRQNWIGNVTSVERGIRPCYEACSHGPWIKW